jgi:hypothetical protein
VLNLITVGIVCDITTGDEPRLTKLIQYVTNTQTLVFAAPFFVMVRRECVACRLGDAVQLMLSVYACSFLST